jgi:hypothetical protein
MWSRKFWLDLAERSLKAGAWALLGTLGAGATGTLTGVDWLGALNVAGYALVIAVLANLLGTKVVGLGASNSASFLPEKNDPPAPRKRRDKGHADLVTVAVVLLIVVLVLFLIGAIR